MNKLEQTKFWNGLFRVQHITVGFFYAAAVLVVCLNILLREIFKINMIGYDEVIIVMVIWLYFIGNSVSTHEENHIDADVLGLFLKKEVSREVKNIIIDIIEAAMLVALTIYSAKAFLWNISKGSTSITLKIPMAVSYLPLVIGFGMSFVYTLVFLYNHCMKLKDSCKEKKRGEQ